MLPESTRGRPLTRILEDRGLVGIVALAAVCKLAIPALIALAYLMLPFNAEMQGLNFVYPPEDEVGLDSAFQTWDGQHYIYLAEQGYRARQMSNVFYPLYPMLLRLAGAVFGSTLTAGLVLSAVLSLIATASLYLMARDLAEAGVAFRCGLFFLAFPTSFYTSLVYSEALFLALVIMLFFFLYRHLDGTLFTYAAVMGLVPALTGTFMAYSRYLLLVFPVFIALAAHFGRRSWMLLVPMVLLQVVLLVFHALNYWVA